MGLFRRLGREVERFTSEAKSAAEEHAAPQCAECGTQFDEPRRECPECGATPPDSSDADPE